MANQLPNDTVYCRFTGEAFTVIDCNGCVATLRDSDGNTTGRVVGEITRLPPPDDFGPVEGARAGIIEALGGMNARVSA